MHYTKLTAVALTAIMITGCAQPGSRPGNGILNGGNTINKQDIGTAVGVIGGGVIGSTIGGGAGKVVATIGGALLGGFLGNSIGNSLDNADRAAYDRASQNAMESGQSRQWKNPKTGAHGTITPKKKFRDDTGVTCREYTQTIVIDGKKHQGHGTACREEDGSWRIVE